MGFTLQFDWVGLLSGNHPIIRVVIIFRPLPVQAPDITPNELFLAGCANKV